MNYLSGLVSNCKPPDPCLLVARMTDMSHQPWPSSVIVAEDEV
jgi:hypothetical protein